MTDIELSNGSMWSFLLQLIIFWVVFVAVFLATAAFWPRISDAYVDIRRWVYWTLRDYCAKDGYDGYSMYLNRNKHSRENMS